MSIYKREDIVGYEKKDGSMLIDSDCYDKLPKEEQKLTLWNIVERDEVEKDSDKMYVCDECGEEII